MRSTQPGLNAYLNVYHTHPVQWECQALTQAAEGV